MTIERILQDVFPVKCNPSDHIWRYMDFTKFVAMLHSRSLYFPRADHLGDDAYECTLPRGNAKQFTEEEIAEYNETLHRMRTTCFINCWHINKYESAAMWKLYLSQREGIAIRSTVEQLFKTTGQYRGAILPGSECVGVISIGEVSYTDYDVDAIEVGSRLKFLMHKRVSFQHERELRAVYWGFQDDPKMCAQHGHNIEINLEALIESVFVAPTAEIWFKTLVEDTIKMWGLDLRVEQSSLSRSPLK